MSRRNTSRTEVASGTTSTGSPLEAPYPGIQVLEDGYAIPEDAVGTTFFLSPSQADVRPITAGPNEGTRFIQRLIWTVDDGSRENPPAMAAANDFVEYDDGLPVQPNAPVCNARS